MELRLGPLLARFLRRDPGALLGRFCPFSPQAGLTAVLADDLLAALPELTLTATGMPRWTGSKPRIGPIGAAVPVVD